MSRLTSVLRSRWLRVAFLVAALAAAVLAVTSRWAQVRGALADLDGALLVTAVLVVPAYLYATMRAWRAVLRDLGSPLGERDAAGVFFVGQLGKYLPGSVWNVLATAELGADRRVPRRRSVTAMLVAMLLSLATGLALGVAGVALAPRAPQGFAAALVVLPVLLVLLVPPVANRLVGAVLRVARRPPLDRPLTGRGLAVALTWTVAGWAVAGAHVWLLALAVGMAPTVESLAVSVSGYALAWSLGFLAIPVPAGVGVREVVLGAMLGGLLGRPEVLVVVLLSRVVLTVGDVAAGAVGMLVARRSGQAPTGAGGDRG